MINVLNNAVMISGFVFVMMLVIEYVNVMTSGDWQHEIAKYKWGQYFLAALLGAIPGCLGSFTVIVMYSHGLLTIGSVVAAMIATIGDESFIMLAMIPRQAILITVILLSIGIFVGALTDFIVKKWKTPRATIGHEFAIHVEEKCEFFPGDKIIEQWKACTPSRGILTGVVFTLILATIIGKIGPPDWNWMRVTILIVTSLSFFIVVTVPDHFLEEHLWNHVVLKHLPRVFLWTFGTLVAMYVLLEYVQLEPTIKEGKLIVLLIALLIGLIPQSGPHLVFVTLYAEGTIPLIILLANSIVQDGHGMLPMLEHSRWDFVRIKAIKLVIGFVLGGIGLLIGL